MNKVYDLLNKITKLNPWDKFNEHDIIQLSNKNGGVAMISFVAEEINAINCFIGIEACGNYVTSLKLDDKNSGYSALRYLNAYSIYFVTEDNIDKKLYGNYSFNEKTGYPIISRNIYGYFQRSLSEQEKDILIDVLTNTYEALLESNEKNVKVDHRLNVHLTRFYNQKKNKFINAVGALIDFKNEIKPLEREIDIDVDELEISNKEIELDVVILPKTENGKISLLGLAVDNDNNVILEKEVSDYVSRADVLADLLIELINNQGRIKLCLRDKMDQAYLAKIIKTFRINYEIKALTHVDDYADNIIESMIDLGANN